MICRHAGLALALLCALAAGAVAQEVKPALVYDLPDPYGKGLNEGARAGAERFKAQSGIAFALAEPQSEDQRLEALRRFAREGYFPIIAVGRGQAGAADKVAKEAPETRLTLIDAAVDLPNIQSILFKEHEGAFLVGLLAAKASRTGKVGFVGGQDEPLTRRHACGYAQGVRAGNDKTELFQNMIGATSEAWNEPVKGADLARAQIDRGADVIFQAARAAGIGVLRAASDAGRLGVGSEVNQNGLFPGKVLTSMVKRADVATERSLAEAKAGAWKRGVVALGVKEKGVGYALDAHNRALVTPAMQAAADKAAADIAAGAIRVHDYAADQQCAL